MNKKYSIIILHIVLTAGPLIPLYFNPHLHYLTLVCSAANGFVQGMVMILRLHLADKVAEIRNQIKLMDEEYDRRHKV